MEREGERAGGKEEEKAGGGERERKVEVGEIGHTQRELHVIRDMQKELTTQG